MDDYFIKHIFIVAEHPEFEMEWNQEVPNLVA
jgi:hypothetical protein